MELTVVTTTNGDELACHEALISMDTARDLRVDSCSYVDLRHGNWRQVFRIKITSSLAPNVVHLAPESSPHQLPEQVTAQAISACAMPVIQCLQLVAMHSKAHQAPPPVGLLHRMLTGRVLVQSRGLIHCRHQGVDYGQWKYQAFHDPTLTDRQHTLHYEALAGVIQQQTLVLVLPFESIQPPDLRPRFVPMGPHTMHIQQLVAMTLRPCSWSADMETYGKEVSSFRSMILHGPNGAGKTTLIHQLAQEFDATMVVLDASVLASRQGQMESLFSACWRTQPSILVMDNLDLLFPKQLDETRHNWMARLSFCLEQLDSFAISARVAIIATATQLDAIHPRIRRLFDEEVTLEMPTRDWSIQLLDLLLPPCHFQLSNELKTSIVIRYGQRPSHLVFLCRELCHRMGVSVSNGSMKEQDDSELQPSKSSSPVDDQAIEQEIVQLALRLPRANDLVDLLNASIPTVTWDSIATTVSSYGHHPAVWHALARASGDWQDHAGQGTSRCNFLSISASDLIQAEVGESEKAITKIFDAARMMSPCMVFIDEFQSLFGNRKTAGMTSGGMISQLLMEMDSLRAVQRDHEEHDAGGGVHNEESSISQRIFVLAATNCLNAIDQAFLQPGRFENIVHVGLPNATERRQILELQRSKMPWDQEVDMNLLVSNTEGASPATLVALCRSASIDAMKDPTQQTIQMRNFVQVLTQGNLELTKR